MKNPLDTTSTWVAVCTIGLAFVFPWLKGGSEKSGSAQAGVIPAITSTQKAAVKPLRFEVSTGESGTDAASGAFRYPDFVVKVRALTYTRTPPQAIRFCIVRPTTGTTVFLTGRSCGPVRAALLNCGLPCYAYEASWNVTRVLGEWQLSVDAGGFGSATHPATTALRCVPIASTRCCIKINKRAQTVQLARYWAGRNLPKADQLPLFNACDGFVNYLYSHLGLPIPCFLPQNRLVADEGEGAVRFFFDAPNVYANSKNFVPVHYAVVSGPYQMVDNNWGSSSCGPREHFSSDILQIYYSRTPLSMSPEDPAHPHRSLLDSL